MEKTGNVDFVVDFSIVRDVMYKYSKKAEDRYFSFEMECFVFAFRELQTQPQLLAFSLLLLLLFEHLLFLLLGLNFSP